MTTHAESAVQRLLTLIKQTGCARSDWLAEKAQVDSSKVTALLTYYVKRGDLVTCKLKKPNSNMTVNEYRLSAAGPRTVIEQDMAASRRPGKTLVVQAGPVPRAAVKAPSRLELDAKEGREAKTTEAPKAPEAPIDFPAPSGDFGKVVATSLGPLPEKAQFTIREGDKVEFAGVDIDVAHKQHRMISSVDGMHGADNDLVPDGEFSCAVNNHGELLIFLPEDFEPVRLSRVRTRALVTYLRTLTVDEA